MTKLFGLIVTAAILVLTNAYQIPQSYLAKCDAITESQMRFTCLRDDLAKLESIHSSMSQLHSMVATESTHLGEGSTEPTAAPAP